MIELSTIKAPKNIWDKIKNDLAKNIAETLINELNDQKAPCKQESIDRVSTYISIYAPIREMKGAYK